MEERTVEDAFDGLRPGRVRKPAGIRELGGGGGGAEASRTIAAAPACSNGGGGEDIDGHAWERVGMFQGMGS